MSREVQLVSPHEAQIERVMCVERGGQQDDQALRGATADPPETSGIGGPNLPLDGLPHA